MHSSLSLLFSLQLNILSNCLSHVLHLFITSANLSLPQTLDTKDFSLTPTLIQHSLSLSHAMPNTLSYSLSLILLLTTSLILSPPFDLPLTKTTFSLPQPPNTNHLPLSLP